MIRAALAAFVCCAGPALAQSSVGTAEKVVKAGFQTPRGSARAAVSLRDAIYGQAQLETEAASWVVARFRDETSLTLAPDAQVTIDDYVYRANGTGRFDLALVRGALRFTSGKMQKSSYSIFTQVAYLGVRGTDFSAATVGDTQIDIWVDVGAVEISPRDNPLPILLTAPAYARCDADGCAVGSPPTLPPTANAPGGGALAYSGPLDGGTDSGAPDAPGK